jgi:hypothetical protein
MMTAGPGIPAPRVSAGTQLDENRRGIVGGFLRAVVGPVWYWLDLYDASGTHPHPDHWKVIATGGYVFGLALVALMVRHVFVEHSDGNDIPSGELLFIGVYSALVFLVPYGMKGIKLWLDWRGSAGGQPPAPPPPSAP